MEEVYQKYAKAVYHYLLSLCRSHDIAEELTQETFYQAIKSIDRYDESYKVSTWLYAGALQRNNVFADIWGIILSTDRRSICEKRNMGKSDILPQQRKIKKGNASR